MICYSLRLGLVSSFARATHISRPGINNVYSSAKLLSHKRCVCKLIITHNVSDDVVQEGYLQRQTKCGSIKIWCKQWYVLLRKVIVTCHGWESRYSSRASKRGWGGISTDDVYCFTWY